MKRLLALLLVPVGLVFMATLSVTWAVPANSLTLWRLERAMGGHEHPAESTLIAPVALLGILDGNGNHCDFLAGQWRASLRSDAELRDFYDPVLSLYRPDTPQSEDNYAPDAIRYSEIPDVTGAYLVYLYDGMGAPDGDIRCW